MSRERADHTLQPTALINEAYVRIVGNPAEFQNRAHFFGIAARMMRQILVDHARARAAEKRGGGLDQITLDEPVAAGAPRTLEVLFVHEALEELERLDRRQAQIVELFFFGGLSMEEIAAVLSISLRTAKRDWSMARAWLSIKLRTTS
jgi:RNA polymerase sigma factor (TIGR02999 family)